METLISILITLGASVVFAIVGTVLGCLLSGIDRIISARMQGRVGPPLLQPLYDVRKLFAKDNVAVNGTIGTYVVCALIFTFLAGGIFFSGGNFLLCVFVITLAELMFVMAAYASRSPFSEAGAHRENLQIMAYEPMVLLLAVGFFQATGSFDLTIKLRKSPFDLSYSHHAHQELVKGVTTEMSGKTLGQIEIMHWCENILYMGWIVMFFIWGNPVSIVVALIAFILIYLLEIWIDNNFARVKWQLVLKSTWIVTLVLGGINILVLAFL